MATNEETNAAGTDTRPPMLNGTNTSPMITDPPTTDSAAVACTKEKKTGFLNSRLLIFPRGRLQVNVGNRVCWRQKKRSDMLQLAEENDMLLGCVKNPRERWTLSYYKDKSVTEDAKEKANHEDAYDFSVVEGPYDAVALMAHTLFRDAPGRHNLDSDDETEISDDNTISVIIRSS
ncbi:hypothetical protein Tco_0639149 [Tanacetum coccineum]